jgi:hypothetical protein
VLGLSRIGYKIPGKFNLIIYWRMPPLAKSFRSSIASVFQP